MNDQLDTAVHDAVSTFNYRDIHLDQNLSLNPDFSLERSDYQIRVAGESCKLRTEINKLVDSLYGLRGLGAVTPLRLDRQPKQVTIAASREDDVFGTLTLGLDSNSGLLADSLYGPEIDSLRLQGRRLCEVTRLAFDTQASRLEAMATLFNVAFVLARGVHARTDLLAEVHPRHVSFYRRTLGYRVAGPERLCLRVGAPAVLMHLCLDYAGSQIRQRASSCLRRERNLYSMFLPVAEQDSLLKKLTVPGYGIG